MTGEQPATTPTPVSPNPVIDAAASTLHQNKPCRFEAPPPPATPPPSSIDLSTQVYVTKRDSLTSGESNVDDLLFLEQILTSFQPTVKTAGYTFKTAKKSLEEYQLYGHEVHVHTTRD
jgi:hypothetical protein